ncbi:MAG: isochorismatase family protein [Acidobacteria bacterium]|nr:isochorismatase family protein [Acidobacteriota bacterium]
MSASWTPDTGPGPHEPGGAALVLIDLQEKLAPHIDGIGEALENVRKLLALAKLIDLPVLLTTQYAKGLGPTVPAVAEALDVEPIDKICFGCFRDEGFLKALDERVGPRATLLLAGVETHICVLQTALGALAAGRSTHVLADAAGSRSRANHELGLARMRQAGCVISSTEMAIYELLGDSRRPEFKQMLPYLK